jgi:hypothetical protein
MPPAASRSSASSRLGAVGALERQDVAQLLDVVAHAHVELRDDVERVDHLQPEAARLSPARSGDVVAVGRLGPVLDLVADLQPARPQPPLVAVGRLAPGGALVVLEADQFARPLLAVDAVDDAHQ